jgi:hypothetical protein
LPVLERNAKSSVKIHYLIVLLEITARRNPRQEKNLKKSEFHGNSEWARQLSRQAGSFGSAEPRSG